MTPLELWPLGLYPLQSCQEVAGFELWAFFYPLGVFVQELNVRQVTLSTNKDKYGVRLRAEPDHMVLGKRLKGAFKPVMAAIKELKSEQLEKFQETGK